MEKTKLYQAIIIGSLVGILLYPIIAHILMYQLGYLTERLPHGEGWLFVQIFLSGPGLITLGLILYLKYTHKIINKLSGGFLILIGLCWLYALVSDFIAEAA